MDLYRGLRHRWGLVPDDSIPRLPEQPIFYPVLNEQYATQIARDWNVKDSGAGYVTRFHVRKEFVANIQFKGSATRFIRSFGFRRKTCWLSTRTSLVKFKSSQSSTQTTSRQTLPRLEKGHSISY